MDTLRYETTKSGLPNLSSDMIMDEDFDMDGVERAIFEDQISKEEDDE